MPLKGAETQFGRLFERLRRPTLFRPSLVVGGRGRRLSHARNSPKSAGNSCIRGNPGQCLDCPFSHSCQRPRWGTVLD